MKKERYKQFYEKLTAGLRKRPRLVKAIVFLDRALVYGFMAAYVVYLGFTLFSRPFEPLYVANKVGLPALCFAAVTLLRLLIKRPRPYEKTGAGIDAIAKKTATGNSMPSRHVASAFVIAMVLIAAIEFCLAPKFVELFRKGDPKVVEIGALALRLQCLSLPTFGWICISNMMMQTTGKVVSASLAELFNVFTC